MFFIWRLRSVGWLRGANHVWPIEQRIATGDDAQTKRDAMRSIYSHEGDACAFTLAGVRVFLHIYRVVRLV